MPCPHSRAAGRRRLGPTGQHRPGRRAALRQAALAGRGTPRAAPSGAGAPALDPTASGQRQPARVARRVASCAPPLAQGGTWAPRRAGP
eukprot:1277744-Lingulodinium_polyedra.AAC.1